MNITLDNLDLNETVLDLLDTVTAHNLKQVREGMIHDYEQAKDGNGISIYVVGDHEADAVEIRKRIEALDLILDHFSMNHEPYSFDE